MIIDKKLKLTIIGLLLGDANIQVFQKSKVSTLPTTARLRIIHSEKQYEYIQHKYEILKPLIRQKKILSYTETNKNGKIYVKYYFNTKTMPELAFFYHMFYKKDPKTNQIVKILPKLIHRFLTPITLAYWFMDDGSLKWKNRSKAVRICTDSFTKSEVEYLTFLLNKQYNLQARTFKTRSRLRIYIPNRQNEWTNIIQNFIHFSMAYKLP